MCGGDSSLLPSFLFPTRRWDRDILLGTEQDRCSGLGVGCKVERLFSNPGSQGNLFPLSLRLLVFKIGGS